MVFLAGRVHALSGCGPCANELFVGCQELALHTPRQKLPTAAARAESTSFAIQLGTAVSSIVYIPSNVLHVLKYKRILPHPNPRHSIVHESFRRW